MKLFQQLLVAPAALGLLAPMAVSAAELNMSGVDQYAASSQDQVTSISQFSDVRPTDWAYQALSNLIERYGCVAGYPNGTFKGGQAMTRYEAAALLNACLDRISEVTDELKKLMAEFEKELAVLRGRVDGLEAKVGELEANQFSTTTKLKGIATFVLGANSYSGNAQVNAVGAAVNSAMFPGGPSNPNPGLVPGTTWANNAKALQGATAFNYDVRLIFDTSFTGKDLLRTTLRAGNFADSPFGQPVVGLNATEVGFEEGCGAGDCGDVVAINRLFYQFPIGSNFTATIGGRVRQDDMLAFWPSVYPADTVLDIFTYAGAPGTYSLNLGAGGGLWWKSGNWSLSANYVAQNGDVGNPSLGGIGTNGSAETGTVQLGYGSPNFGLAAAYTYSNGFGLYTGNGTPMAAFISANADSANSVGISGYLQPTNSGIIPSLSFGWGLNSYNDSTPSLLTVNGVTSNVAPGINSSNTQSWYLGLQWPDAFIKGNTLGMAVGQATFLTKTGNNNAWGQPNDGNYAWEWWYKFQVTDNISVTPAIYYLSVPEGQFQKNNTGNFSNFGGMLKTTFKF